MKNLNELNTKTYNQVLVEASEYFDNQGIRIIGEGYKEIATSATLFEQYVGILTEGATADQAAIMGQLMVNTNAGILRESSMSGIQPIASLSMPVIRKLWPKFALKDALKTEVAKSPRFVVSYTKPYMFKGDSDVKYLPKDLKSLTDSNPRLKTYIEQTGTISAASGAVTVTFNTALTTSSVAKKQSLDTDFHISSIIVSTTDVATDAIVKTYTLKIPQHKLDVANSIFLNIDQEVIGYVGTTADSTTTNVSGQVIIRVDLKAATAMVAVVGFALDDALQNVPESVVLALKAGVSTEWNEDAYSVGFDIARMDIDIPSGQHINAPLPIEALNDMMALYQIDGTKEAVDLMTNVLAMRLDLEVLDFLQNSWANQPGVAEFQGYPEAGAYTLSFDVRPSAGFAGSPKAWREELKPQIDWLSQKIKNETYLQSGIFTIVGNPLDVQLLTNIDWQFRGGQGANMDGVDVDYSIGTYVGANAYRVISSVNVAQGGMFLLFTPSSDTQMTYKYFPYTFSTEQGYIDPNRSRVPSIMMTKRHTFAEFLPAIGMIEILHNDGTSQFNPGYTVADDTNWGTNL